MANLSIENPGWGFSPGPSISRDEPGDKSLVGVQDVGVEGELRALFEGGIAGNPASGWMFDDSLKRPYPGDQYDKKHADRDPGIGTRTRIVRRVIAFLATSVGLQGRVGHQVDVATTAPII